MKLKEIKRSYKEEKKRERLKYKTERRRAKDAHVHRRESLREQYLFDYAKAYTDRGKRPPINPPRRAVLEEIGNAVTHGVGSIFAVFAFVFMLLRSDSVYETVGAAVYFFGLFVMFTMSCLYHAFAHGTRVKRLFRRFDYSCIYLLIGATFAPILLSYVGGTFGLVFFIAQWAVIAAGITFIGVFGPERLKVMHFSLYIVLGWCGIIFLPWMLKSDPMMAFYILGGGVIYSLGIIPFSMKTKVAHFIWHFFVLAGAVFQWVGVYLYVYLK